jgi:hypothetical protein
MTTNPLNDISKVYLEKIASVDEAAKPDYLDFDKDGNKKESMKKALRDKKSQKVEEANKPNDGNLANNYPPYDKVTRGDVIAGRLGKDQMGGKKKVAKESFSNWRQDLAEVMTDTEDNKKIKEKKIQNKVTINPKLGESVEQLGGTLLEMVEIDEFDYILESAYDELLEEGYDDDAIEDALEYALTEAKVTFGHDTPTAQKKKEGLLSAARKRLAGAKAAAKQAVATGARKVAKGALGVARKMEAGDKKPAATAARKPSTYRGAGAGQKERVSSGSYTPPAKKKAEKPADPWEGSATTPSKPKAKKAAAPKAKAPAATTAKKKRKSKLDALLADVRNEETQIDEKITAKTDMGTAIKDFYASKSPQLAGRTKEERRKAAIAAVLTARRGGRKLGEQMTGMTGSGQPVSSQKPEIDKKQEMINKQKYANLKMLQQKKQQLERQKLQMQKSGKLPLEAD